jgi:fructose-1,6-bisphosphatase I
MMPERGNIYSVNEANFSSFPTSVQEYLQHIKTSGDIAYTSRYVGSLVADFHRTLLKGGIFMYPQTKSAPNGKLRLMYECNPMAFIAEQAGGMACSDKERVLDIVPEELHQRIPFFIGSTKQVEEVMSYVRS